MLRSEDTLARVTETAAPLPAAVRSAAGVREGTARRPVGRALAIAVKNITDRVGAAVLLVMAAPLLVAIAAAVWLSSSGPIFYRQRRVGRHGDEFTILKFRTMVETGDGEAEADAAWATAELGLPAPELPPDRSTRIGRVLRRYGVDELPQLLNVLKGDMALVGPRPERSSFVSQFERHIPGYRARHRMRPGMTGWAQVHGLRGQTSLHARTERDNEYIDRWSLWLDLRIVLRTPAALLAGARDPDTLSPR